MSSDLDVWHCTKGKKKNGLWGSSKENRATSTLTRSVDQKKQIWRMGYLSCLHFRRFYFRLAPISSHRLKQMQHIRCVLGAHFLAWFHLKGIQFCAPRPQHDVNHCKVSGADQCTDIKKALLLQTRDTHWRRLAQSDWNQPFDVQYYFWDERIGESVVSLVLEVHCAGEILFLPEACD